MQKCQCKNQVVAQEESQSTPALLTSSSSAIGNSALSLGIIPEHSLLESCARLSVSLEGPGVFAISSKSSRTRGGNGSINLNGNKNGGGDNHDDANDNDENDHNNYDGEGGRNDRKIGDSGGSGADREIGNKRERKRGAGTGGGGGSTGLAEGSSNGIKHSSSCTSTRSSHSASANSHHHMTMDELRAVNRYAESTKSLSYLPQVRDYYVSNDDDSV